MCVCYECCYVDNKLEHQYGCCGIVKIPRINSTMQGVFLINFTEVYVKTYDISYAVNDINTTISINRYRILTKFDFSISK